MTKLLVLVVALAACGGKSAEERGREAAEEEAKRRGEVDKNGEVPEVVKKEPDKKVETPVDAPPMPEPTTPEEIDKARKQAMIDGREKDVIKYCEMLKVDDKSDPQIRLGCTLAACRVSDADKARAWSGALPKELKQIAVKTCVELKVGL